MKNHFTSQSLAFLSINTSKQKFANRNKPFNNNSQLILSQQPCFAGLPSKYLSKIFSSAKKKNHPETKLEAAKRAKHQSAARSTAFVIRSSLSVLDIDMICLTNWKQSRGVSYCPGQPEQNSA